MIAAWMLFATEIGALMFAAAWIAESVLQASRRPVRGVWVAAIVGTNVLPLLLFALPYRLPQTEKWALSIAPESIVSRFGTPLLVLWGMAVAIGLFVCLSGVWRMSRTRPSWTTEHVDNTPVLVSHDIGPALVGVLQYSIVVPRWAYGLEENARGLLLTHEREHARKYDPLLLAVAVMAVVLAPWNLFNWLLLRRLHLAVELDCDQRVLRAHPDARGYGALLLDVAERVIPSVMPAAAFVEHGASLETRLNAMSEKKKSFQGLRLSTGLAASLLLVAGACIVPRPIVVIVQPAAPVSPVAQQTSAPSTFERARDVPVPAAPNNQILNQPSKSSGVTLPPARGASERSYVEQLDEYEHERIRGAVMSAAPRALGDWPRADSAIVLLFNSEEVVVKTAAVSRLRTNNASAKAAVFAGTFMIPEISLLESAVQITVDRDADKKDLDVPLLVFVGRMQAYATVPLLRSEVVPSDEARINLLRTRHPELKQIVRNDNRVGALLYGSRGQLLRSSVITVDDSAAFWAGSNNAEFEKALMKKAYGAIIDSGAIIQSGKSLTSNDPSDREGPRRMMYAVLVKHSEMAEIQKRLPRDLKNVEHSGYATTNSEGLPIDRDAMNQKLFGLVQAVVPSALGTWSRGDSAVLIVFDANEQVVLSRATPVAEDAQLMRIAGVVNKMSSDIAVTDIQAAGVSVFPTSASGRRLDRALYVYWARMRPPKRAGVKR